MIISESSMSPKGQVTIPKELREEFGMQPGQKVRFSLSQGTITVEAVQEVTAGSLAGALAPYAHKEGNVQEAVEIARSTAYQRKLQRERGA